MKLLITSLLVLLVTTVVTTFVVRQPGYVLFSVGHYSAEMSLTAFWILFVAILTCFYFLTRLILRLLHLPQRFFNAQQTQRLQRAQHELTDSLIEAAQGNWARAERLAIQSATTSSTPFIHYLSAARAAQQQEKYPQRDEYLLKAGQSGSKPNFAVDLTKAELQLEQGQPELALETLKKLYSHTPQNRYVLKVLSDRCRQLKDWDGLFELLGALSKAKVYTTTELQEFKQLACEARMAKVASSKNAKLLQHLWKGLPANLRNQERLVQSYAKHLCELSHNETAERVLRNALNKSWSDTLAFEYGQVQLADSSIQLSNGEAWLREHGNSGALILSLARICRRTKLWGKARIYFESSLSLEPLPETFYELADLLEHWPILIRRVPAWRG